MKNIPFAIKNALLFLFIDAIILYMLFAIRNAYGVIMDKLVACFIGHRNAKLNNDKKLKLKMLIENLIVNENVYIFLFGSHSDFDYLCHKIVTELKEKYCYIQRKCYTCKNECCTLENERERWEKIYSCFANKKVHLLGFEQEVEFKGKWAAGKASYVERNKAMVEDSDFCIFFYDKDYKPKERKYTKKSFATYQPKSGTALAYKYAKQKNKKIINIYDY